MKRILSFVLILILAFTSISYAHGGGYGRGGGYGHGGGYVRGGVVHVRSSMTRSGHYIRSYYRTAPNHTKLDNWSTRGNVNPYTGQMGTKNPF